MGRAFEYRKARKLKRWGNMSRTFTKIGKEITIAVKAAGPDPAGNSACVCSCRTQKQPICLRTPLNAPSRRLPTRMQVTTRKSYTKDTVLSVSLLWWKRLPTTIPVRLPTCAATSISSVVRSASGSLSFLFDHKCVFKVAPKEGVDLEELELGTYRLRC